MVAKLMKSLLLALALLLGCSHMAAAFFPVGEDMDFISNDSKAKSDMDRMMLMNSDDPKLRAEAQEAFQEIMRAKRLSTLQECRRTCVTEHEEAAAFRTCNDRCEATLKPGEYAELPILHGEKPEAAAGPEEGQSDEAAKESGDSSGKAPKEGSGEL